MIFRLILFLIINFLALGLGSYLMAGGSTSEWYNGLNKAPWTPPGWMFGAAWSTIMICFAIYMSYAYKRIDNNTLLIVLYALQLLLNIIWSPVFFKYHYVLWGLIIISLLTILIAYFFFAYLSKMKYYSLLVLPYLIWLLIATSLNMYIYLKNPS